MIGDLEIGVVITLLTYLVIVTSYVVGLRKDLNSLQGRFSSFERHFDLLEKLREDFIRLETEIKMFLNLSKEENN